MFIDCTGLSIRLDPTQYPTGVIIQLYSVQPPGRERIGSIVSETGYELEPKIREPIPLSGLRGDRCLYSITEHWEHTVFDEEMAESFDLRCYYLDNDNNMVVRDFTFSVVDQPEGWVLELEDEDAGGNRHVSIRLPDFHPEATIRLHEQAETPAEAEEKPPGRPIWERLNEDD